MSDKTGIIEYAPGQKSSTRVMCLILLATWCAAFLWSSFNETPMQEIPASWLPFIFAAIFGPSGNTLAEGKSSQWRAQAGQSTTKPDAGTPS